jgi:hypothetical protein
VRTAIVTVILPITVSVDIGGTTATDSDLRLEGISFATVLAVRCAISIGIHIGIAATTLTGSCLGRVRGTSVSTVQRVISI